MSWVQNIDMGMRRSSFQGGVALLFCMELAPVRAATEQCHGSMLWDPMQIHELDSYHTITHGAFARAVSLH